MDGHMKSRMPYIRNNAICILWSFGKDVKYHSNSFRVIIFGIPINKIPETVIIFAQLHTLLDLSPCCFFYFFQPAVHLFKDQWITHTSHCYSAVALKLCSFDFYSIRSSFHCTAGNFHSAVILCFIYCIFDIQYPSGLY